MSVLKMMDLRSAPITDLFPLILAGDTAAFDALFLRYYTKLTAFARQFVVVPEAAEEIASEVFVKLWLKRHLLGQVAKPEVYLYVAVKNAALNHLRSEKNRPGLLENEVMPEPHSMQTHEKELSQILTAAIAALPEQRRLVFCLIKENGLKAADVASILGISVRTVESQLYKSVKFLADKLSGYLGYHPQRPVKRKNLLLSVSMFLSSGVL